MAVQQNKKSPSRRGMRRSHRALAASAVSTDSGGRRHLRHHLSVSPEGGHYRGRQVFESKPPAAAEKE